MKSHRALNPNLRGKVVWLGSVLHRRPRIVSELTLSVGILLWTGVAHLLRSLSMPGKSFRFSGRCKESSLCHHVYTFLAATWCSFLNQGWLPQGSGGYQSVSHRWHPAWIPSHSIWVLWLEKWKWDRFGSEYLGFTLLVPFHQCSIVIELSIIDVVQSLHVTVSLHNTVIASYSG